MSASIELLSRPGPLAKPSSGTLPDVAATQPGLRAPELTIVVPTFNETANIAPLVERIAAALVGVDWEVIFVDDDSPDGTADTVRDVARGEPRDDLHRSPQRARLLPVQAQLDLSRAIAPAHDFGEFRALLELPRVDACGRGGEPTELQ